LSLKTSGVETIWDVKDNFEIYFRTHCESDQGGSGYNAYEGFSLGCDTDGHDSFSTGFPSVSWQMPR
jgi:hypothetical protein